MIDKFGVEGDGYKGFIGHHHNNYISFIFTGATKNAYCYSQDPRKAKIIACLKPKKKTNF
jgi:hypothetical protein